MSENAHKLFLVVCGDELMMVRCETGECTEWRWPRKEEGRMHAACRRVSAGLRCRRFSRYRDTRDEERPRVCPWLTCGFLVRVRFGVYLNFAFWHLVGARRPPRHRRRDWLLAYFSVRICYIIIHGFCFKVRWSARVVKRVGLTEHFRSGR